MALSKKYVSIDIESRGQNPWDSSMLSFGACIIDGKFDKTFYSELKPITDEYLLENFKVGASKLNCLKDYDYSKFNSKEVLDILKKTGEEPRIVMPKFYEWILKNTQGYRPVLASDNNQFDGSFIFYYLSKFNNNQNPFGYSSENINSVFRSASRNMDENVKNMRLSPNENQAHNALEDSINQGIKFYNSLKHLGHKF